MSCAPCRGIYAVAGTSPAPKGECCHACAHAAKVKRFTLTALIGPKVKTFGARLKPEVGRAYPGVEIAQHDANVTQLLADIRRYEPPQGLEGAREYTNWASLKHRIDAHSLGWGAFKTAQKDDWYWGDDDEQEFASLKTDYNQILDDYKTFTKGTTKATKDEAASEGLKQAETEEKEKGFLEKIGIPSWAPYAAAAVAGLVLIGPIAGPVIGGLIAKKAAIKATALAAV